MKLQKVVVVPDSFKGTMSSLEICRIMTEAILARAPGAQVIQIPVADGGEGSVDAFLAAAGGRRITLSAAGPWMEPIEASYGMLADGTAVIETAACAGLPLAEGRLNPGQTTTYGVGQLLRDALERGCRRLILGLGGSATNDLGAGAAAAMGVRFTDSSGREFVPLGETLDQIARIDLSGLPKALEDAELIAMCDVDNPLCGPSGAARVFAPQKGADPEQAERLDRRLAAGAAAIRRELGRDVEQMPGAGAAGGLGGGAAAFLGAVLRPGIETVLDLAGFDEKLRGADLVLTGEGRLDSQSLRGKVVAGVARRCRQAGVPAVAIVGDIGEEIDPIYQEGISAVLSINRIAADFRQVRGRSASDLRLTVDTLFRLLSL